MRLRRPVFSSKVALRLVFASGAAAFLAGCADATRFSYDPFANPFGDSSREVDRAPTAAIPQPAVPAIRSAIQSQPLPAPQHAMSAPPPRQAVAAVDGKAGAFGRWSAEGGTPIVVAGGDTAASIATRYGVPLDALLRVNGFSSAAEVRPGARLVVPVYRAAAAKPEEPAPGKAEPVKAAARSAEAAKGKPAASARVAEKREPAPASQKPSKAAEADRAGKQPNAKPKLAQAEQAQTPAPSAPKGKARQAAAEEPSKPAAEEKRVAKLSPKRVEPDAAPAPKVDKTPVGNIQPQAEEKSAAADAGRPEFRWPARGRIIQAFNVGGNDGINISMPEGTAVKAAEAGTVAYAGNELKGYGNLVLIRHANGFVTAYAHNGEIDVKRGETVKRGQTIAKSGQSGNVGSPQLHFELRKGSTPVDPTQYLAAGL